MGGRLTAAFAGAVILLTACSSDPPTPAPAPPNVTEEQWDVIGKVTSATFGDGYTHEPADYVMSPGGAGFGIDFRVGPLTLTMADGTTLTVPARTPGGNSCKVLLTDEDKEALTGFPDPSEERVDEQFGPGGGECWIIAATAADGRTVEWFQVKPGSNAGVAVGGAVSADDSSVLTEQGWRFPYDDGDVSVSECAEALDSVVEVVAAIPSPEVFVDPDTGTVRRIACPGSA